MGTTKNGVYDGGKSLRRETARKALEAQLLKGIKPRKSGMKYSDYPEEQVVYDSEGKKPIAVKLTAKDIARINKELEILAKY